MYEIQPTDRVAPYADLVRSELRKTEAGLSVKELQERLSISERLVRDGVERLQFLKEVKVYRPLEAKKRGMSAFVYQLVQPQ
jgi:ribosome-binding protein aMBF1 (putative translation factor)